MVEGVTLEFMVIIEVERAIWSQKGRVLVRTAWGIVHWGGFTFYCSANTRISLRLGWFEPTLHHSLIHLTQLSLTFQPFLFTPIAQLDFTVIIGSPIHYLGLQVETGSHGGVAPIRRLHWSVITELLSCLGLGQLTPTVVSINHPGLRGGSCTHLSYRILQGFYANVILRHILSFHSL